MTAQEFNDWLKEHDNKISIKQIKELGLVPHESIDKVWYTSDKKMLIAGCTVKDEDTLIEISKVDPIVEPQIPKTEEVVKKMHEWLDTQHYEEPIEFSNKPFYDKFYQHKGRKYRR